MRERLKAAVSSQLVQFLIFILITAVIVAFLVFVTFPMLSGKLGVK